MSGVCLFTVGNLVDHHFVDFMGTIEIVNGDNDQTDDGDDSQRTDHLHGSHVGGEHFDKKLDGAQC